MTLWWIVGSGIAMVLISMVGSVTLLLGDAALRRLLGPLVALAAGTLFGGAFFHMIPAALAAVPSQIHVWLLVTFGFAVFLALEQFLHWHHCHRATVGCRKPLTYLILIGDGLHKFIGGLAIAGTFLIDIRLGLTTWLAAAAHEIPQELGDFGVLVHGGWSKGKALLFNVLSASTFLLGGLVTWFGSAVIDVSYLIPFAAGNFLYIGAVDLVPEIKGHESPVANVVHFGMFVLGVGLMVAIAFVE